MCDTVDASKINQEKMRAMKNAEYNNCANVPVRPMTRLEKLRADEATFVRNAGIVRKQIDFLERNDYFEQQLNEFDKLDRGY